MNFSSRIFKPLKIFTSDLLKTTAAVVEEYFHRADKAEALYHKAIELTPDTPHLHFCLSTLLHRTKRYAEAETSYRRTIQLGTGENLLLMQAYYWLAQILSRDPTRYSEAEIALQRAIELGPNFAPAHLDLGVILTIQNRHAEAEKEFRKVIQIDPRNMNCYLRYGRLLAEDPARAAEAEATFRKAIRLDPKSADASLALGLLLEKQGHQSDPEIVYREFIRNNPLNPTGYHLLAHLLAKDPLRYQEAESEYQNALSLEPDNAAIHFALAFLLEKLGRHAEAETEYRQAISLNPQYAEAYGNLGGVLHRKHHFLEAETAYRKAIELAPSNPNSYRGLINVLRAQNRNREMLPLLEKITMLDPKDGEAYLVIAAIQKQLGNSTKSAESASEARALIPNDDWYNLTCLESICGNTDAAIEHLRRAALHSDFDRDWAWRDPDLEWIRADPRFQEIVGAPPGEKKPE